MNGSKFSRRKADLETYYTMQPPPPPYFIEMGIGDSLSSADAKALGRLAEARDGEYVVEGTVENRTGRDVKYSSVTFEFDGSATKVVCLQPLNAANTLIDRTLSSQRPTNVPLFSVRTLSVARPGRYSLDFRFRDQDGRYSDPGTMEVRITARKSSINKLLIGAATIGGLAAILRTRRANRRADDER